MKSSGLYHIVGIVKAKAAISKQDMKCIQQTSATYISQVFSFIYLAIDMDNHTCVQPQTTIINLCPYAFVI